ncbi:MAG TPA: N-6 DNA methylase [Longimicrobium sp.]
MKLVLPYSPLSEPAYRAVEETLVRLGFARSAILPQYRFSLDAGSTATANAVAFAHPTQRTPADFAAFSVYNDPTESGLEGAVEALARTGAPFHLVHRHDAFDFWITELHSGSRGPRAHRIESGVPYNRLAPVLGRFRTDLRPERIVGVKQGREVFKHPIFAAIQPLQLAMWAVEVTGPVLSAHFAHAVGELRSVLRRAGVGDDEVVTSLAVRLLGAVVLGDTGALGERLRIAPEISLEELLAAATEKFERYFAPIPEPLLPAADAAYQILRHVSYAGFTPHMLVDLYTEAYTPALRKKMGRYDTPIFLTRRIWDTLPVEFLSPEQRVACDMTCGWGSFLIAGHERLGRLQDMQGRPLRSFIHGNDSEPLAARLAGLGLLLSTLEDSWHIDAQDALSWDWLDQVRPGIIVGNPPFSGDRKAGRDSAGLDDATPSDGERQPRHRRQQADEFLIRAIDRLAPGGLLGMIMPRSFVVAQASPGVREKLLRECDVHELWELPQPVFRDAAAESTVLFARKNHRRGELSPAPVAVRTVQPKGFASFRDEGRFTESGLVASQRAWDSSSRSLLWPKNTHLMQYSLVLAPSRWRDLRSRCVELRDRAVLFTGLTRGNPARQAHRKLGVESREVAYLPKADSALVAPYRLSYRSGVTARYPDDFEWPRTQQLEALRGTKVVFSSVGNPSWGRRVRAAVERRGHFVSDGFWVAVPTDSARAQGVTPEVLAAAVGWSVSNAWIVDHLRSPKLLADAVHTIPFPRELGSDAAQSLTRAVRELERETIDDAGVDEAAGIIDRVLIEAYGLDTDTFRRLRALEAWGQGSTWGMELPPNVDAGWKVDGSVESVDGEAGLVVLRLTGFDGPQHVPIGPNMPGWMLRNGTSFRTTVTRSARESRHVSRPEDFGAFRVMPYAYMTPEEVLGALGEAIHGK